jgi:hypothetical protein
MMVLGVAADPRWPAPRHVHMLDCPVSVYIHTFPLERNYRNLGIQTASAD